MLLRSSSTPVLGSLISSFSESPNHHLSVEPHPAFKHTTPPTHHHHHHIKPPLPLSGSSSPLPRSAVEPSGSSFRKSNSEGNLIGLDANPDDHFRSPLPRPPKCSQRRLTESVLEKIPSSSFHSILRYENEDSDDDEEKEYFGRGNAAIFGNSSLGVETIDDIIFLNACKSLEFVEQEAHGKEMYLAMGLGVENLNIGFGGGGGSGGDFVPVAYGTDGGDGRRQGAEEHYKKLIEENPGNPLFLRNYAQYLFESKKDLTKSEELYSHAILADPGDGEVLSQYAKLIWELHHDRDRALNYFERAVQAASVDSHVHAAYASFLWEMDGDEEEDKDGSLYSSSVFSSHFRKGVTSFSSI